MTLSYGITTGLSNGKRTSSKVFLKFDGFFCTMHIDTIHDIAIKIHALHDTG
jgi:hypothetical protein